MIRWISLSTILLITAACSAADISSEPQLVTVDAEATIAPEQPTFTPNVQIVTLAPNEADLPPTWTPTFTATITETPTITPTRTLTPTLTPIDESIFCTGFTLIFDTTEGQVYGDGDLIEVTLSMEYPEKYLIFGMIDPETEQAVVARISQQDQTTWIISPAEFPANGEYIWAASVSTAGQGGLCEQTGTIVIEANVNIPPPSVMGILADFRQKLTDYRDSLEESP